MTIYFSDNFEDGTLNAWGFSDIDPGQTVLASAVNPHNGNYCARATLDGVAPSNAFIYTSIGGAQAEVYARAYAYFSKLTTTTNTRSIPLKLINNTPQTIASAEINTEDNGVTHISQVTYLSDGGYVSQAANLPSDPLIVAGRYYCIEMYYKVGAGTGAIKLWIDGVLTSLDISGISNSGAGNIVYVMIGERDDEPIAGGHTVDIDDVVVSDTYNGLTPTILTGIITGYATLM